MARACATNRGLVIAQEFTDLETAKASRRINFDEMLLYLKKHQTVCRTMLVEKTDRLYRNIKDYATLDDGDAVSVIGVILRALARHGIVKVTVAVLDPVKFVSPAYTARNALLPVGRVVESVT